jgi:TonB family protein
MTRIVLGVLFAAMIAHSPAADSTAVTSRHALAIHTPRADYSFAARSHWLEGRGLFILSIRPDGTVESVAVTKSTGHPQLDQSAMAAFRQWRFVPGRLTKVKIPIEFTLAGLRPRGIDASLQAEKNGERPLSGYANWAEYWRHCIALWNAYHRPEYTEYFRKHRKAIGLPKIES